MPSLHAVVKGETSSSPPGYLTLLLVAVPIAGSRLSEAQVCKQAVGLGFSRTHCHRRKSEVSKLVFHFRQTS